MCTITISNLSQLIADSLTPLIVLDPEKVRQENGIAMSKDGVAISPQVASVVQYMLDLINQENPSENDKTAIKGILDITTASLQSVLNQLGSKLDKQTKQPTTLEDFRKAIDTLGKSQWYELKSKITNIFSSVYI